MNKLGYIKDSFPLHDGPWQWTDEKQENLNDRQVSNLQKESDTLL